MSGSVWECLGVSGRVLGVSGSCRESRSVYECVWECRGVCGSVQECLVASGSVLECLVLVFFELGLELAFTRERGRSDSGASPC